MTEPQISPLARRLAEENSIDWRVIPGTGPESRVIERDILTYLARIMSGEIDPPALPDASEPASPGGAAPDLSEVSNLAAASAGMAKEGIDLSSLLGGVIPAATSSFAAPSFAAPEAITPEAVMPAPSVPAPIQIPTLDLQGSDALPSSPMDFSFSDAPPAAAQSLSLDQISFGDSPALPEAFQAPTLFGDSTPSAPASKLASADQLDAEFEIDIDDFEDAPAALEVSALELASGVYIGADDSPSFESLTSPDLDFSASPADLSAYQADLVLDIDSTAEAPLTIAAMDASNEIADDLVMADITTDFASPEVNPTAEAFNLEPVSFGSLGSQPAPAHLETAQLETAQLETAPVQLEHDDFEFDLIDTEALPVELVAPASPVSEPIQAAQFTSPSLPLESDALAGQAVTAAAAVGGMLVSAVHPEPVGSPEPAQTEPTPPEPIAHVAQPTAVSEIPAAQPSAVAPSSPVASGFFQGFAVRRHFDSSALTRMQHELTQSLNGREVPLEVFLARAAQRNLHTLGIGDVVTLTRLGDTLEPLHASGLHHSFIEAVQSVARATPGAMQGLLILDASSLGADDLVLPVSQPVLTLNVKGEYGHLALAGDLPASKAADFLGKVAQALEIPVSLVI